MFPYTKEGRAVAEADADGGSDDDIHEARYQRSGCPMKP